MKAIYRADANRGGFISTTLVPANRSQEPRFGVLDAVIIVALLLGTAAVVRLALAS